MACGCSRNRSTASGVSNQSVTYKVMVGDPARQVYESSQKSAAEAVASRFNNATIVASDGAS